MARETSVVTPERFQQGFSYSTYIEQIKVNKARFEGFYEFQVKPEDAAALKELVARPNGRPRCWCWAKIGAETLSGECRCWPASRKRPVWK